jgi:hypothetical protein
MPEPRPGSRWRSAATLPFNRVVWGRSVSGIECQVARSIKVLNKVWTRQGVDRVHCWRRDRPGGGDLWIVAWKPLRKMRVL